jgi:hypothetical protein
MPIRTGQRRRGVRAGCELGSTMGRGSSFRAKGANDVASDPGGGKSEKPFLESANVGHCGFLTLAAITLWGNVRTKAIAWHGSGSSRIHLRCILLQYPYAEGDVSDIMCSRTDSSERDPLASIPRGARRPRRSWSAAGAASAGGFWPALGETSSRRRRWQGPPLCGNAPCP